MDQATASAPTPPPTDLIADGFELMHHIVIALSPLQNPQRDRPRWITVP